MFDYPVSSKFNYRSLGNNFTFEVCLFREFSSPPKRIRIKIFEVMVFFIVIVPISIFFMITH